MKELGHCSEEPAVNGRNRAQPCSTLTFDCTAKRIIKFLEAFCTARRASTLSPVDDIEPEFGASGLTSTSVVWDEVY